MKHIQGFGFNFDHRMAHKHRSPIKKVVHAEIWEQLCPEWFIYTDDGNTLKIDGGCIIKKFTADIEKENQLDGHFINEFENSKVEHVKLSEDFFYQSFYCNEKIYSIAKPESCILMDIDCIGKGSEAIVEALSFETMSTTARWANKWKFSPENKGVLVFTITGQLSINHF